MANIILTTSEQNAVRAKRLKERPTYYSASAGSRLAISQDFETFLILQGSKSLKTAAEWLVKTTKFAEVSKSRTGLAKEFLDNDKADTEDVLDEVNSELKSFTEFRDKFQAGKFSSVGEVSMLIDDMQAMADEMFLIQDRLKHRNILYTYIEERLTNNGMMKDQVAQTTSWLGPLLAY